MIAAVRIAFKETLKWPLIAAAIVVVVRVITERAGALSAVNNMLSIAALTTVLAPIYFALQIGEAGTPRPHRMLLELVFIYAVCARTMVLPTYWAARIFHWHERRFAGLSDSNAFLGFVALPLVTAAFWVFTSVVSGSLIGGIVLKIMRPRTKKED